MALADKKHQRIFGLDIVRAIAILMVLICHFLRGGDFAIGRFAAPLGQMGVELFFVLSGYLIGGIFFDAYYENEGFSFSLLVKFWCRRWLRTLPNYYLFLLGYLICAIVFDIPFGNSFRYFFFIQNFSVRMPDFFGASWSLSFEEWFYLLFPFFVFAFTNTVRNKKWSPVVAAVIIIAASVWLRNRLPEHKPILLEPMGHIVIYRLDSMMVGILLAILYRKFPAVWERLKSFCVVGAVGLVAYYLWILQDWPEISQFQSRLALNFYFPGMDLACASLIPYFSGVYASGKIPRIARTTVISLSKWAYSLYLSHMLVQLVLISLAEKNQFDVKYILIPVGVPLSFLISRFTFTKFEKPIMDMRDRISFIKDVV